MKENIFIRIDADNIGDSIELSLINNDIKTANLIHQKIQAGISDIEKLLYKHYKCDILMKGCDDILFKISSTVFTEDLLLELKEMFFKLTGYTLSIGVAYSLERTLINLRKAKLSGKNTIVTEINK